MTRQLKRLQVHSWTRAVAATVIGATSIYIYRILSRYGVDGTLRLLWEGSPYPPGLREPHEALDDSFKTANSLKNTIQGLTKALEGAQLAEESNFSSILRQWQENAQQLANDLRQELAMLSHQLDVLAARVDAVVSDDAVVKQRKKELSLGIVELMERADALISFYTKASSPVI